MTTTESPRPSSRSHKCEPINPAPPVTSIFMLSPLLIFNKMLKDLEHFFGHLLPPAQTTPIRDPDPIPRPGQGSQDAVMPFALDQVADRCDQRRVRRNPEP